MPAILPHHHQNRQA
jgi:hypothetical protein